MKTPKEVSASYSDKLVEYRRFLHAYPELTNEERETSAWIREKLRKSCVTVREGISGNSVVGLIDGEPGGPCVAFRGDMDALPIRETNDVPYRSTADGIMHACGHDAHTAILLCLAEALAANRELVKGRVVFLFQQGEEGGGGAEKLVAEGATDGVDCAFGLHVGNAIPVGTICMSAGTQTASSDSFVIRIHGRGTHGATPHLGVNPIAAGCAIVTELGQLRSRLIDPLEPCVVSVCQFTSGNTANVYSGGS